MRIHPHRLISQCPACRQAYREEDFAFLGEEAGTQWFHASCGQCFHQMMAFVLEMGGLVSSIGMSTDATKADAQRFLELPSLQADECIAIHQELQWRSKELCAKLKIPLT